MKASSSLILLVTLLIPRVLHAQVPSEGVVSGMVTDSLSHAPLENATVVLRSRTDSTRVVGASTAKDGRFNFSHVPFGTYVVECSLIGHVSHRTAAFTVGETAPTVALAAIALKGSVLQLDEVVVKSERSLLSHGVDRKVYNVDRDVAAQFSTAGDLLQKIPSVQVDVDGNVSLRGSTDVTILVNGKKSPLMGKNRADVLQQLPASGIDRIEVITNPSARFTPEGTSGVINLVMKQSAGPHLGGDATVNAGSQDKHNESLSLSGRIVKFDVFGNFSNRDDRRTRIGADDRLLGSGAARTYDEDSRVAMRPLVQTGAGGFTFHATSRDAWDLSGEYFRRHPSRDAVSTITTQNESDSTLTAYDRTQTGYELERETGVTSAFQHDFAENHTLRVEANFADAPQSESTRFVEHWTAPAQPDPAHNILFRLAEKQGHVTADYERPLGENAKFETGYAFDLLRQDTHSDAESLDVDRQVFVPDPTRTYEFRLEQSIHALYATYQRELGRLDLLLGLRAEQAVVTSDLVSAGMGFTDRYPGLFPTIHLGYKTGSQSVVQLSYSHRIHRPNGDDLNPYPEFTDPYNMEAGNQHLRPESTHSFELGYQMRADHFSFVPSLYYRYKTDGFTRVTTALTDTTFFRTMENLARDQSAGFEPVVSLSLGRALQANLSANLFYERIDASNLGYSGTRSVVSGSGTGNLSVMPWSTTTLQATAVYRSARLTPQGEGLPSFLLNVGGRQNLIHDRVSLTLAVTDLLKTQRQETDLDVAGIHQHVTTRRDSQIVYAGMTYHFGRPEKKTKDKPLQFEEQP